MKNSLYSKPFLSLPKIAGKATTINIIIIILILCIIIVSNAKYLPLGYQPHSTVE